FNNTTFRTCFPLFFIIENRKSLCHSLGRPSRSDFVQFQFAIPHTSGQLAPNLQPNTRRPHSGTPSRKSEKGLLLFFCPK
ncbi:hypothetical protein WBS51_10945, partial [Blautia sp. HA2174]|uniref:hypothetical protein n=1 Tax=Blautia sp. HA2174 TaxID=3133036 RepID=UPI003162571B